MVTKTILGLISTLTQIDAIASMHLQDIFEITFKTPSTGPINVVGPNQFASGHSQNSPEPKGRISTPLWLKVSLQDVADRVNPDDNLPSFTDWNSDSTAN